MDNFVCDSCATPLPAGSKYCSECGTPAPGRGAGNGDPGDLRRALQAATAGEYEIHHELGRGGMGSVFLGREIGLDRLVAIKVLPPKLMFDDSLVERFKREARMVAKLHHPNIIPVYRVHHTNRLVFYTMHYVPGRTLGETMTPNRTISLPEIEKILLEAGMGLGYAHKRGVIHRDVKPANILIDGESTVHLTDFGIAKALVGNTQLTETGAVIGTPQYMAPEQCEGRLVDGRADQYSLAVVGYQLLAGHCPFESDSMKELMYHHLFSPPVPLDDVRPDTPAPLRDALHKALSKDPADRFDSMEDFQAAVEGKGPPIFVSWIDGPEEKRRPAPPPNGFRLKRSSDVPTTEVYDRRRDTPTGERSFWDSQVWPVVTSHHRQAMGALAAAVLIVAAVGVLALTRGAGAGAPAAEAGMSAPATLRTGDDAAGDAATADVSSTGQPGTAGGTRSAAPPLGRLQIRGQLPAGASLAWGGASYDGAVQDGSELELPAGEGELVISAAGFEPFSRSVTLRPEETLVLDVRLARKPPPRPTATLDSRPQVPARLFEQLGSILAQGQVLHDVGHYLEAAEMYRDVKRRVNDVSGRYRNPRALDSYVARADSALQRARLACELEQQPKCP